MLNQQRRTPGRVTRFPRRRQGSFGLSKLIVVSGSILGCFLLTIIVVQLFQHLRLREQLTEYELRIRESETRNEAVSEEIGRLHEPGYIELLARKYLGLVKPGETVFQLED